MDLDDDELLATRKLLNANKAKNDEDVNKAVDFLTENLPENEEISEKEIRLYEAIKVLVEAFTPIWEQKMKKNKMSKEEAIDIVDSMYQDRMHTIEDNNTIYVKRLEDVEFTNLEFAAVVLLRETQISDRKLNDLKKKVRTKITEFKDILNNYRVDDEACLYSEIDVYERLIKEFEKIGEE